VIPDHGPIDDNSDEENAMSQLPTPRYGSRHPMITGRSYNEAGRYRRHDFPVTYTTNGSNTTTSTTTADKDSKDSGDKKQDTKEPTVSVPKPASVIINTMRYEENQDVPMWTPYDLSVWCQSSVARLANAQLKYGRRIWYYDDDTIDALTSPPFIFILVLVLICARLISYLINQG
jgi:hypothetical protein